jgi:hypothetical protein
MLRARCGCSKGRRQAHENRVSRIGLLSEASDRICNGLIPGSLSTCYRALRAEDRIAKTNYMRTETRPAS